MFKKIIQNEKFLGHQYRFDNGFAFFGSKFLQKEDLSKHFPEFHFRFLKQVHGNRVIQANSQPDEADGHWSDNENEALVIQTADCMPLMIHTPKRIIAVHAGWRGVEQNILEQALAPIKDREIAITCGPFIDAESFEVGEDVALRLLSSDPLKDPSCIYPHEDRTKRRVDLKKILINQAKTISPTSKLEFLNIDTFSSPDHFSYRRNGARAGRLFSFIVRHYKP